MPHGFPDNSSFDYGNQITASTSQSTMGASATIDLYTVPFGSTLHLSAASVAAGITVVGANESGIVKASIEHDTGGDGVFKDLIFCTTGQGTSSAAAAKICSGNSAVLPLAPARLLLAGTVIRINVVIGGSNPSADAYGSIVGYLT